MLPFRWGLFGVALLFTVAHGASINAPENDDGVDQFDEAQRSKRSYKRGQTQSQYLNFGQPELDGKAEAEATESGSRSTVSGAHGMGQAQSQFSSGDCSGCGVGSPIYEYSTGSPDPLTLGGNVVPYTDGKPSSIIGLHGTSPAGVFGPDRSGVSGGLVPGSGQLGQSGGRGGFSPASMPPASAGGGSFTPGAGGQLGRPGSDGTYVPGSSLTPGISGAGQFGRPGTEGSYGPGGAFIPGTVGQIGRPGTVGTYIPPGAYAPSTPGAGQIGKPGAGIGFTPGSGAGVGDGTQRGTPGTSGAYAPEITNAGQVGRPGVTDNYAPGRGYHTGTSPIGQVGRPGPGGVYAPGTSTTVQTGAPSASTPYLPGREYIPVASGQGQEGKPAPGSGYAAGRDIASQPGRPGAGDAYTPGGVYAPAGSSSDQTRRPTAGSIYTPGSGYGPGVSNVGQTGTSSTYQPGTGLVGATGTSPGYGPAAGAGGIGQPGTAGFAKPGVTGNGQQVRGQDQPSHLVAPPMTSPGTIQGGFGHHGQPYGVPGQQTPTYIPGSSYSVPGSGKQQVPQYGHGGHELHTYDKDGTRGQPGQQFTSYGQPGHQLPSQKISPTTSFYGPSPSSVSGTGQQFGGQALQPGYLPGYTGQSDGTARPGMHYAVTGPQHILQQPAQGTISKPGAGGITQGAGSIPQGVGGIPQGAVDDSQRTGQHQPSYQIQPNIGYGQPGPGRQSGVGYQPERGFGQPGAGGQQGRVPPIMTNGGVYQPGYDQSSVGFLQPGFTQAGSAPQVPGLQPPGSNRQPGAVTGLPGAHFGQIDNTLQGSGMAYSPHGSFPQHGTGFEQSGSGSPPTSGYIPGVGKQVPQTQQGPSVFQQAPGYTTGYGQQAGTDGNYPRGTMFDGIHQPGQTGTATRPATGMGSQIGTQPISGPQSGPDFSQYPAAPPGISPAGVHPAGGIHQGSGYGTGYDTSYGPQPSSGYGQVGGGPQYSHPGVVGGRLPDSGISQYSPGPQTIVQPGASYLPSGVPASGFQQNTDVTASGVGGVDDAFSQAESSIGNGQAAASAQGKKNGGTAKTQVQGTYTSSGSFSASAMTSDNDRSASSQVTGGVEGAMSQSQGQGGAAQSQAQVQVNEKTGGTKASSQSGGIIHQSQSEVQANDKGGLADAQSSGPGQTSSQAQIGFRPGQDGEIVRSAGGGQASAQSGAHSGNSQSQIQGTSKYGVSYHGAAQSASGTKEQVATYREQNRDLFNTISQFGGTDAVTDRVDTVYNPSLTSESDIPDLKLKASRTNKEAINSNKLDENSILTDEEEEEEPYDEYEDEEDYYNENPIKMDPNDDKKVESSSLYRTHTQTSPTQSQQVAIADSTKKYSVVQNQNGRIQTYSSRTTTETVPNGFRGTVNVEKKFHTKSLEPHKTENKLNITADEKSGHKPRTPDSFVTVTKSITGSMDNSKNPPQDNKNFQSTYYTKSSTCGYFTFSCNIVYGANGRSKICRPKAPTNGKC